MGCARGMQTCAGCKRCKRGGANGDTQRCSRSHTSHGTLPPMRVVARNECCASILCFSTVHTDWGIAGCARFPGVKGWVSPFRPPFRPSGRNHVGTIRRDPASGPIATPATADLHRHAAACPRTPERQRTESHLYPECLVPRQRQLPVSRRRWRRRSGLGWDGIVFLPRRGCNKSAQGRAERR